MWKPFIQEVTRNEPKTSPPDHTNSRWLKNFELEDARAKYLSAQAVVRCRKEPREDDATGFSAEEAYDNPGWDEWKKADTDDKRKALAMKQFGNQEPGNPNRCMTFTGHRRTLAAREQTGGNRVQYDTWLPFRKSTDVRLVVVSASPSSDPRKLLMISNALQNMWLT